MTFKKTVGALLIDDEGRVLLGLRSSSKKVWPDHWDAIGGRVETGESLDAALIREVQEEISVTPISFELIATVREREPERFGDALHHIYAVTQWTGGAPQNTSDEHSAFKWFEVAEMRRLTNIVDCDYPQLAQRAIERMQPPDADAR
jgi:8-oxo-dGTP diphosphatase